MQKYEVFRVPKGFIDGFKTHLTQNKENNFKTTKMDCGYK